MQTQLMNNTANLANIRQNAQLAGSVKMSPAISLKAQDSTSFSSSPKAMKFGSNTATQTPYHKRWPTVGGGLALIAGAALALTGIGLLPGVLLGGAGILGMLTGLFVGKGGGQAAEAPAPSAAQTQPKAQAPVKQQQQQEVKNLPSDMTLKKLAEVAEKTDVDELPEELKGFDSTTTLDSLNDSNAFKSDFIAQFATSDNATATKIREHTQTILDNLEAVLNNKDNKDYVSDKEWSALRDTRKSLKATVRAFTNNDLDKDTPLSEPIASVIFDEYQDKVGTKNNKEDYITVSADTFFGKSTIAELAKETEDDSKLQPLFDAIIKDYDIETDTAAVTDEQIIASALRLGLETDSVEENVNSYINDSRQSKDMTVGGLLNAAKVSNEFIEFMVANADFSGKKLATANEAINADGKVDTDKVITGKDARKLMNLFVDYAKDMKGNSVDSILPEEEETPEAPAAGE